MIETPQFQCPQCAAAAKSVPVETVSAFATSRVVSIVGDDWRFCGAPNCPVVYFTLTDVVDVEQVSVVPFQKSTDPNRLVCFCFGHSVAELEADLRANGESTIRAEIKRQCQAGEDECRTQNPQGRCCLGNVGSVLRSPDSAAEPCCDSRPSDPPEPVDGEPTEPRAAGKAGLGAALGLAALSSACCWIPALGILLGVSTAGIGAALAPWRLPALILSALFLFGGLVLRRRWERQACADASCATSGPKGWRIPSVVSAAVLMFALYPAYASSTKTDPLGESPAEEASSVTFVTYALDGMTCGGCESHVETLVSGVESVVSAEASYVGGSVVVGWSAEPKADAVRAAVRESGFLLSEDLADGSGH
jgi:copper chaperone CopZ